VLTVWGKRGTLVRQIRHNSELQGLPHHDLPDPTTTSKRQWEKEVAIWRMKSRGTTETLERDKQVKHEATNTKMDEGELTTPEIEGTTNKTKAF
jgi:hypothetical protein